MLCANNKVEDLQIAYIGGGSTGWAWGLMRDLALEEALSGTIRLYDIDMEAAKKNEIIGNSFYDREGVVGKWEYTAVNSLEQALTGADFVIISILPGTMKEMESDVHLPERLGIYQPVGDTAGPGGIIRSLRTVPMFITIAEAIRDYAPNAWVINYTNPMTLCVKTLYHAFPGIKAFGCCHEVFGTQEFLRDVYQDIRGVSDVDRQDIEANVIGINHFTWFTDATYHGEDLFPILEEYMKKNYRNANAVAFKDDNWMSTSDCFSSTNQVKMDLYKRFGCLAAAGDRHLAEFMPSTEYLNDPDTVASWQFALTPVSWRIEGLAERQDDSRQLLEGTYKLPLEPSGEEGVMLIKALLGLGKMVSNVNIPNTYKQIGNLPVGAVVETNALFERDHIRPVIAGDMPEEILGLTMPHVENHERVLKAAVLCDKELVVEAFLHDPQVKAKNLPIEDVRKLVNDMIANTKDYLPQGWN